MKKIITVSIVDDDDDLREHIAGYLTSAGNIRCKSAYASAEEALEHLPQDKPDVILMDISMPHLNGIQAARQLQTSLPGCKIIFVTMHADAEYVKAAFRAGASGYVLKRAAASELMTAIREVLQGRHYVTPLVTKEILNSLLTASAAPEKPKSTLTPRQREVLRLVAEGRTHREIAGLLHIAIKTVEFHKAAAMRELGLRNSAELIRYALAHGFISS